MNTLDNIRKKGGLIAKQNGFFESPKIDEITLPNEIISDFIERVQTDYLNFRH